MGLDISACSKVTVFPPSETEVMEEMGVELMDAWVNSDFPNHMHDYLGDVEENRIKYSVDSESDGYNFRAGSYSGYNRFRTLLCQAINGITAEELWQRGDMASHLPFYMLINFSDCEGVIGGSVAEELHRDFVQNREEFVAYLNQKAGTDENIEPENWISLYDEWTKAFAIAADEGLLFFH